MAADVEWLLLRIQVGNNLEKRLVNSTFQLGILQGNADLTIILDVHCP